METIFQDLRYGIRMLLKRPGFTLVAVLALTLGIGANTAIFSVVNGVLLRPLPYTNPDRIVTIWEPSRDGHTLGLTDLEYFDYREQNHVFEEVAAFATGSANLTGSGEPERVVATWASAGLFPTLGVEPALGRVFTAEDDKPGGAQVVLVTNGLWQRRFGSDPNIIGQQVSFNGVNRTIIGVMPRSFYFDNKDVQLWLPLRLDRADLSPGDRSYNAIARLRSDVTLERARVEMNSLAAQLAEEYKKRYPKGVNSTQSVNLIPLHDLIVGEIRPALLVLLAAIGFVLLIACANVANLLLARAEARQKEIAIRIALGAGRRRIIQQLLTESVLLSLVGGATGLLLAFWGVEALLAIAPPSIPRTSEVSVDVTVLIFTLGISLLAGILFGLVPGLQSSKVDLHASFKGGRGSIGDRGRRRTRRLLVVSEIALSLVLLVGAGLMIKSFWRLMNVDPGFNPANVLTAQIALPPSRYPKFQQVDSFYKQLLERVEALPGVQVAGTVTALPLGGNNSNASFEIEGKPRSPDDAPQNADYRMISENYFRAMGIPLLRGRYFLQSDQESAPAAVIINEAMTGFWSGEDPLGKRINLGVPGSPWLTIVGIAKDIKHKGLDLKPKPEMYFLHSQNAYGALGIARAMTVVARTSSGPITLAAPIKSVVHDLDKDLPLARIQTMDQVLSNSVSQPRFTMLLLSVFSVLALVLAVVGVYGVVSFSVAERTQEFGIRMALGANARDVMKLVLREGLIIVSTGVTIGLALSLVVTRLISSFLYNVRPSDPLTYLAISLLLLGVAIGACFVPGRRATKVDPMEALRYQ